ncbi:hypothetical protein COW81_03430 [Candidatus Campbellbacteria bacterium CG22_combo_CG10-13_8_21_14_all_36_13]|uniref:M23ase beta-sheet core domain-containing protein n=1 Tax=Candidatus Campbellbacteria bacterium CG22_combo_CG10-13_8_21_14_all_36_13 TaxID=1974529 RepID=A0A2H0DYQ0_9BACT|nr:MAG: hypothetical protein COW81_03430 [Candidatus Campbellbacteria bacterium CG22_combo_CG10-13_8_21_14_all_36_13]
MLPDKYKKYTYICFLLALFFSISSFAYADVIDAIRNKMTSASEEIKKIEKEIEKYEEELQEIGEQKKTLTTEVSRLNTSAKKLSADLNLTQSKIYNTNLTIDELELKIEEKEKKIEKNKKALVSSIRSIQLNDDTSLIEAMLTHTSLTDFWSNVDTLETFQNGLRINIQELHDLRAGLQNNKEDELAKRIELGNLSSSIQYQKQVVDYNKREKDKILSITKNEESKYQEYLNDAQARREEFERELSQLESELKIAIDPSSIPKVGKGILAWPLDKIIITQKFGTTAFSKTGAYNGKGHNGVDFGIPTGTPVKTAGSGVVQATGNTDESKGCYSYGKWVLIKHGTGLSTLYAHLSVIKVSPGQNVALGDVIAYSGNTGYSTGPHLHFTLYASQGVQVRKLGEVKAITNCGNVTMPIAPFEAYLNPLDYL